MFSLSNFKSSLVLVDIKEEKQSGETKRERMTDICKKIYSINEPSFNPVIVIFFSV